MADQKAANIQPVSPWRRTGPACPDRYENRSLYSSCQLAEDLTLRLGDEADERRNQRPRLEIVRDLAVDIVNAGTDGGRASALSKLLIFLDALEQRYGALPSILATRADFIDDASARESLLNDAYSLARLQNDKTNALHISHSLATFYIEDLHDLAKGKEWLRRLKEHLDDLPDQDYLSDYERLMNQCG